MKTTLFIKIALRVITLFTIGSLMTYLPTHLHDFFGDKPVIHELGGCYHPSGQFIDDGYKWGTRHYWYFWMMFFLFILSLIHTVIHIAKDIKKEYPNVKF